MLWPSRRQGPAEVDPDLGFRIDAFVASTRSAIFVREADDLLLIRPDKTLSLNRTAVQILGALYERDAASAGEVIAALAPRLGVPLERLANDAAELVEAVRSLLNEDFRESPVLRHGTFDRGMVRYPTLAEIALTYGCQNACTFCYAASPGERQRPKPMTTAEVCRVMDKIFHQAHVPSLSFTGGEATLRRDLPELIRHGRQLGFRINLISNGLRLADRVYAESLAEAGLDSAQISIEAGEAELHDRIVGRPGAFEATCDGVRNLRRLGLHVHTNSTLCPDNAPVVHDLIRFVARELELPTMSMNMVIRAGFASADQTMEISYDQVAELLPEIMATARDEGIRLVWYSPIPYCIFNPVLHDLGAKSCACVDGILSVDPTGQVLPCSSFEHGIGSLLEQDFDEIFNSPEARFWKDKAFVPPVCRECDDVDVCAGACPLYWDEAEGFAEIPRCGSGDAEALADWRQRRAAGGSYGITPEDGR